MSILLIFAGVPQYEDTVAIRSHLLTCNALASESPLDAFPVSPSIGEGVLQQAGNQLTQTQILIDFDFDTRSLNTH